MHSAIVMLPTNPKDNGKDTHTFFYALADAMGVDLGVLLLYLPAILFLLCIARSAYRD